MLGKHGPHQSASPALERITRIELVYACLENRYLTSRSDPHYCHPRLARLAFSPRFHERHLRQRQPSFRYMPEPPCLVFWYSSCCQSPLLRDFTLWHSLQSTWHLANSVSRLFFDQDQTLCDTFFEGSLWSTSRSLRDPHFTQGPFSLSQAVLRPANHSRWYFLCVSLS